MHNIGERDAYQQLLEGVANHALFMLDTEGCFSMWPAIAQQFYGYEPEDTAGRRLDVLFADERGEPPPVDALLAEAKDGPVETDGWHERADGSVFWATCTLSPLSNGRFDGYAVIVRDTTTRKQYERMLERQNDRLKEFTDILSHDLRTPLGIIDGRLELFRESAEEEHLAAIERTTDRMARLVEDLLRVARQGQVVENPEPTDIDDLLDIASEGALPATATLRYESIPTVMADPDRLVQVFENLLRNSAEHGGDDVTVRVGPLRDGFYVEDDGPGIPESDRERVFDHGYTTREDGTGYGLSVVRSIVGAHGWDVSVSGADGGGARFEITGIEFVNGE
jgi:PAS domain S-box-containing protein